jgi:hypothetical protein
MPPIFGGIFVLGRCGACSGKSPKQKWKWAIANGIELLLAIPSKGSAQLIPLSQQKIGKTFKSLDLKVFLCSNDFYVISPFLN